MARNLPRKLLVSCPVEKVKHMKKWFKLQVVAGKKKDHAVTENEKRLALQRKNQLTVKRKKRNSKCNKRKVRILKPYSARVGKENRKHKLFRPPQCCDAENSFKKSVSECHGSKQDRRRETVVVTSTGMSLAVAGFSHDHCYPQSSSPSLLNSLEDSLQTLLETCDVDVDFLQKAKPSHDVLFDEVLNHCDVPPDEMFSDIEDDADGHPGTRGSPCKCCLAFSWSVPSKGIFTTAGSTETQLSTCAFPRTLQTATPLPVLEKEVQQSVDFQACPSTAEDWMSCTESSSCPARSVASELDADFRCPLVNDGALPTVRQPTCTGAKTGDDDWDALKLFLTGVGRDKRFGSAVVKFCSPLRSADYSRVCKDGDSVTTREIRTTQSKNRECGATTHIGSIDGCSGRVACLSSPSSSPSSCPLVHSLPSFHVPSETSLEASYVPSFGRKRKQGNGIESSGKRCKTDGQDSASPSPTPSLESDATSLPPDGYQDIPIPPSLSPCWDLPIFDALPPPLSPLSDDSGILGSDDDAVTLGNTSDDGDDRTGPVAPGCGERDEVTSKMEVESRAGCVTRMGGKDGVSPSSDEEKDVPLKPGDGVVRFLSEYEEAASCLDNHYKLFRQALPLSPITNSRFDRCV